MNTGLNWEQQYCDKKGDSRREYLCEMTEEIEITENKLFYFRDKLFQIELYT